ncbi:SxtJ family membrane protein [Pelagibacteraceae bacterium]|nr:SxtJ family membrane protein [Pelagibacteraceae bacterium]
MKNKKNSNKSFGILFFIVFLIIGLYPLILYEELRIWSIILSVIFLILGISNSKLLTPLKYSWLKLGETLGKFIAPIVMFFVYFIFVTPIGLILRIFNKDIINLRINKSIKSYWIKRDFKISFKKQF